MEEKLDRCFEIYYGLHHDVGFMWLLTAVADYRLTGNSDSRRRGLHAANLLAGRFNPAGNFIRAWNECPFGDDATGWVIIDSMMNIPLLYWAWEETGDPRFRTIAVRHADTVMDGFFREDGSCCHIVEFDPSTGRRVRSHRGQGYAHGSAWSRGQAWAIYGFALSAMHTGETRYLEAARRAADYFIARIPENGLIPADFCQPDEPNWEDSAAAAIAACGLLSIAEQSGGQSGELYLSCALKLLGALYRKRCNWEMNCDCILENCTAAYHADEHHIHMIYGDYYFIEAVFRLCRTTRSLW